jgi:hypothetical protein
MKMGRSSIVDTASRLRAMRPKNGVSVPCRTRDFFFSQKRLVRQWGICSVIFSGSCGGEWLKLTTQIQVF